MSAVCILIPTMVVAWPVLSASVAAAAAALGFKVLEDARQAQAPRDTSVTLAIDRSEVVTDRLGRDRAITLERGGVTVTFSRDARGQAGICVRGEGRTQAELEALGRDLSQRVIQQYVYQRLKDELQARDLTLVEEEVGADRAIRIKVRQWEN